MPEVCAGSYARPSGGPGFVIRVVLFALVAARVQFDPGGGSLCAGLTVLGVIRDRPARGFVPD